MPKKRRRLYLETSFWKRLAERVHFDRRTLTWRFLTRVRRSHRFLISNLVLLEIRRTPDPEERQALARRCQSIRSRTVTNTRRARELGQALLAATPWSQAQFQDMMHISYAILGGADAVVTWDRAHIACETTRRAVALTCRIRGLTPPFLGTPSEVLEWLGNEIG